MGFHIGSAHGPLADTVRILHSFSTPEATLRLVEYPPNFYMPAHSHAKDAMSAVLSGSLLETAHDREFRASAGTVVVKPAGTLHEDRFGPSGALLLSVAFEQRDRLALAHGDRSSWRWLRHVPLASTMYRLVGQLARASGGRTDRLSRELGECIERSLNPPMGRPAILESIERVKARLDAGDTRPVKQIARELATHPVQLAREFRQVYGCSIREYRSWQRAANATTHLASGACLSTIAHSCGFYDHAQMCRDVRRHSGLRPGELRALLAV